MATGRININDYSKQPYRAEGYADMRGIVDFGNLVQFAPYEKGYAFLAVINGPAFMEWEGANDGRKELQDAFIKILEQEFRGLDGIDDITSETMEITDNISSLGLISRVLQPTNNQITMRFTEKSGSLLTKYISMFLRYLKDPRTLAKTYGGAAVKQGAGGASGLEPSFDKEVFNMLYIITDSTCLNVEKAFLLLNAQPTSAPFAAMYNVEKGEVSSVEIDVIFNAFTIDGYWANKLAQDYLDSIICNAVNHETGKININSWRMDWSISSGSGVSKMSKLKVENNKINIPRQ